MKIYKRAVLPSGFKASAVSCGIKKSGRPDLALMYSKPAASAACLFTVNKVKAAPVIVCKRLLKKGVSFNAIIANSGNANCFTGRYGIRAAEETIAYLARELSLKKENILVASTGIIGRRLPVEKIKKSIPVLVDKLSFFGINDAKKAIMTTDTFPKEISVKFVIGKKEICVCAIAKGAGMIAPNMATLLVFILTDANIKKSCLRLALKSSVAKSFNSITVDGCMSTNDSVMLLANSAAGNKIIDNKRGLKQFSKALDFVCIELAKMIVRDAEGASKFIEISVAGAKTSMEAKKAALAIANSNLFKTACYGQNPNFGRIASAIGASGINVKEERLKIAVSSLKKKDIFVNVFLGLGSAGCKVYTSDLTPEYIKINAEYN